MSCVVFNALDDFKFPMWLLDHSHDSHVCMLRDKDVREEAETGILLAAHNAVCAHNTPGTLVRSSWKPAGGQDIIHRMPALHERLTVTHYYAWSKRINETRQGVRSHAIPPHEITTRCGNGRRGNVDRTRHNLYLKVVFCEFICMLPVTYSSASLLYTRRVVTLQLIYTFLEPRVLQRFDPCQKSKET